MQALSTMKQTERLKVLEYLYDLLCWYEAWDREVSSTTAQLDSYRREKTEIRKKHKTTFGIYMWFIDSFIMASIIFVFANFLAVHEGYKDLFSVLPSLLVLIFFVVLLIVGYIAKVKADKKSCSDVLLSEYLAEVLVFCHCEKKKIANEASNFMKEYVIPGALSSTEAVEYVYDLLLQYPQMQLFKAVEYYNSMKRDRREREERARISQQLETIKKQAEFQHREKMEIARQIEATDRNIAMQLDDIRYATGSHY